MKDLVFIQPTTLTDGSHVYDVVVLHEDEVQFAKFNCADEREARALRDAIREHALGLDFVNGHAGC